MRQGLKKYAIGAGGMLVLVMAVLLATGGGSAVAGQISSVFVTNDAAHAVPVQALATPVTDGGGADTIPGGATESVPGGKAVIATALSIHLASGVTDMELLYGGATGTDVADFLGPDLGGNDTIVLDLARPIAFDHIRCSSTTTFLSDCVISWVGGLP
jgi:hypothetical protein